MELQFVSKIKKFQFVLFFHIMFKYYYNFFLALVKISKRINTLNTRSLTGGTINNQVSRLPVIGFGTDLIFRPKTDKNSTPPNATSTPPNEEMPSSTATTIITVESNLEAQMNEDNTTSTLPPEHRNIEDKGEQKEEKDDERHRLRIDIPQNLMDKVTKRPHVDPSDRSGSYSSKYAIWDEGDSYIIENYDGEDIHVIPSSSHNTPPQEQNRGYFLRRKNTNGTGGSSGSSGSSGSPDNSSSSQQSRSNKGATTTKSV
ncbi:hypothetical protein RclHR1_01010009 [Rhizophagus clarus]|uniref:Uncharacterized protein n=1 Tax=Rhizophagus clarus TaxID=94130 RepID=A0A2Z6QRD5_9GLOM|nr:hypothetical protein RclHR1_01010009 [Rhizophagus clarus]